MIFGLTIEILETLVSVVLDVHGLSYNPRHRVRVFAENLDLEVGWSSPMVLLLVVPDEAKHGFSYITRMIKNEE